MRIITIKGLDITGMEHWAFSHTDKFEFSKKTRSILTAFLKEKLLLPFQSLIQLLELQAQIFGEH